MRRFRDVFLISLLIIAIDRITKYLALSYINPLDSIEIFPFLHLVIVNNKGGAFGMFKGIGSGFFIGVSVVALIFVIWLLIRSKEGRLGLSLVLGGAVGNLIDRIVLGHVVDFIDFSIGKFHWPAFNMADSALTTGIMIVLLSPQLRKWKLRSKD